MTIIIFLFIGVDKICDKENVPSSRRAKKTLKREQVSLEI